MENKRVQTHVELDEYHNHIHVLQVLQDLKNILSKIISQKKIYIHLNINNLKIHTETVAAISPPAPPVIGAS